MQTNGAIYTGAINFTQKLGPGPRSAGCRLLHSHHISDIYSFKLLYNLFFVSTFVGEYVFSSLLRLLLRNGELLTQKLKSHLLRTQSLKVVPLKPGVGKYIATHATLTARDFFLAYFYPPGPFTCIFQKRLPIISCVGCG